MIGTNPYRSLSWRFNSTLSQIHPKIKYSPNTRHMLKITEIFPNPKGSDGNQEWIELTNFSTEPVNLGIFTLDDSKKGSKPFPLPQTTLQPNQTTLFQKSETKINLNNTEDLVRLIDQNGQVTDQVEYTKPPEAKSYALTTIKSQKGQTSSWQWAKPTPNKPNKALYQIEGTITSTPEIQNDFTFTFQPDQSTENLQIIFTEDTLDFETAKLIIIPNTKAQILTNKTNQNFQLIDYEILETQQQSQQKTPPLHNQSPTTTFIQFIPIIILLLLLPTTFLIYKLQKNKNRI